MNGKMSEDMKLAVSALQTAIDDEYLRKAKLGYNVVIEQDGKPKVISAKSLLAKQHKTA